MTSQSVRKMQCGVALVIVMMFIVILSGVAAFAARKAIFGEGLSRNQLDVEIASQAAEAALRDAEFDLQSTDSALRTGALCARGAARPLTSTSVGNPYFGGECPTGQCRIALAASDADFSILANSASATNVQPWWPGSSSKWNNNFSSKPPVASGGSSCSFNGGVAFGTFTGAPAIRGVLRQPEYLIEYFNRGGEAYFRVTARGWGLNPSSEVVMQSFFSVGKLSS